MTPWRFPACVALWAVALLAHGSASAQESPSDSLRLEGQLRIDGTPADTGTVTLHRVGAERAGPVDSVAVDREGRFTFTLPVPPSGAADAEPEATPPGDPPDPADVREAAAHGDIFFASTRYQGILYHGPPLADPEELETAYLIEAHSAVEAAPGGESFPVALRQLLFEEVDGWWEVTDVLEVENRGERTYVPASDGGTVWSHPLPEGAERFQVGEGDLPPDRAVRANGEVRVSAPFPPGGRLLVFRYVLPRLDGGVPLAPRTDSMEVFVREPAPEMELAGLERVQGVEIEPGAAFRRYAGPGPATGTLAFEEPGGLLGDLRAEHLVVALTLLLAAVGVWALLRSGAAARRKPAPAEAPAGGASTTEPAEESSPGFSSILEEVALLDEAYARGDGPPEEEYRARRRELLERLSGGGG